MHELQATPSLEPFLQNLPGNLSRRVRRPNGTYFYEYVTSGLFRQFGVSETRVLAEEHTSFDWIHPDDRERFVTDLEVSAATLSTFDHRVRVIGNEGRVHWAWSIGRPSRRADGCVVWDGIVIDVTREVEAEAALRVAKAQAERAQVVAAGFVVDVVARLKPPLHDLKRQLRSPFVSRDKYARLVATVAEMEKKLFELGQDGREQGAKSSMRVDALTTRQRDVLHLLRRGLSNKSIAQELAITPGTVKLHVAAILRATSVRTRRQLYSSVEAEQGDKLRRRKRAALARA